MADPRPTVPITNLTDAPGGRPAILAIYSCNLAPGETIGIPVHLIDKKFRILEHAGLLAIGKTLPEWYTSAKKKQRTRPQESAPAETGPEVPPAPIETFELVPPPSKGRGRR